MIDLLERYFSTDFMPHGHCYFWTPSILWVNAISDALIAVSYYSIPLALFCLVRRRSDLKFSWMFSLFGLFILGCGTTHIFEIVTIWYPAYGLAGIAKALTAAISVITAIALWPLLPRAIALPSHETLEVEIRDRRKAENDLTLANEQLEVRVESRTAELTKVNDVLREEIARRQDTEDLLQRRAAELASTNAELHQFAFVASHDLREPLRMVTAFTQLIQKRYGDRFDTQAQEMFDFVTKGASRMEELTQSMLELSRINSRQQPAVAVDSKQALDLAIANLSSKIAENQAVIEVKDLPVVSCSATLLTQLFQNLLMNSLVFRGKDTPTISIESSRSGNFWEFVVRDNGIGIDAKYSDRIFEIFRRLHTREEYPGTGIGLAVCRKVVEKYGGKIWVESKLNEGAAFHFTLTDAASVAKSEIPTQPSSGLAT